MESPTPTTTSRPRGRATGALLPDELALGPVRLRVTELERALAFYVGILGLVQHVDVPGGVVRLGTPDGTTVLEMIADPSASRAGRHAGLYHVALLYPSREELAHAVERIAASGSPVEGASDHGTHEAIYLPDPDGNGLELAVDRPSTDWPDMTNVDSIRPRALDLQDLLATVADIEHVPTRVADGLRVGHMHLHVGDIDAARAFWVDTVGFEQIAAMPTAAFVSAGGYHHHLAFNTWRGDGVPPAPVDGVVGMVHWTIELPSVEELDALEARLRTDARTGLDRVSPERLVLRDPWGMELQVTVAGTLLA